VSTLALGGVATEKEMFHLDEAFLSTIVDYISLFLTSLLPTGKCRHSWKEWRWYQFSVFAGCQEWRHKALGHFESDFPHSRVLSRSGNADESKYQYNIHVQYVSCASRFLFTITICDLMLLFFSSLSTWLLDSFDDWSKQPAWILIFPAIVGTQLHVTKRLSTWWRPNDSWRIHCVLV
jgi:hypothetical protein